MTTTVLSGTLVLPDGPLDGWLRIEDGLITDLGSGTVAGAQHTDGYLLPGLVDMHCHGGGGGAFEVGETAARRAAAFHAAHGTTTVMASLGSTTHPALLDQVRALAPLVRDRTIAGVHLEGPYLSTTRRGAHSLDHVRTPDSRELAEVLAVGGVRMVTVAPELPGAAEMIAGLPCVAALGHTDATYAQATAGIAAGATVATHLFNGMRPVHHRDGGVAVACLEDERVTCELICDGHHVSPEMVRLAFRAAPGRVALITDACVAAGMPDGDYRVGTEPVRVVAGEVRTTDGRSLAGSGLTLLAAVANAVRFGIALADAV
ncbi:N-acetylglucosamine-6-phosphate deacetylase, partial [Catellatospora methionotrophica]|uniref:N-acetylglucosamine-6-phosphate deacetylase n=1 Tax=Catellatospora methionotrophica TaxID=121620 RepID=UPI0033C726C5